MKDLQERFNQIDRAISGTMARYAIPSLRLALAIIYIWFGALKVFGVSPVADLVGKMSYGVPRDFFIRFVGIWEMAIGIALLFRLALRLALALFSLQLAGTFLVFVLHPREAFRNNNPLLLTQTGEFILKNLVLFAAGLAIGGTVRRGREDGHSLGGLR